MMSDPATPTFRFLISRPQHMIALSMGAGLSPVWPGTAGSVLGFGLYWSMQSLASGERMALYLLLFAVGAWCSNATGRALGQQDHRSIVWDETVGMSIVLEFIPASLPSWIAGFVLFRLFDVLKPWPIYLAHNVRPNGFWVMLDDVLASGYAIIAMLVLVRLSAHFGEIFTP